MLMSHLCYCIYKVVHVAFVLVVFVGGHVAFVICIWIGAQVACVLFVFVGLMSYLLLVFV